MIIQQRLTYTKLRKRAQALITGWLTLLTQIKLIIDIMTKCYSTIALILLQNS